MALTRVTRKVLFNASPVMLAVALGMLGPAALNDDEDSSSVEVRPTASRVDADVDDLDAEIADVEADAGP